MAKPDSEKRPRHTVVAFAAFLPEPDVEQLYEATVAGERDFVASRTTDENPD